MLFPGNVHNNTAEAISSILERVKLSIFHYLNRMHLSRYLHEIGFRWDHRVPEEKITQDGKR